MEPISTSPHGDYHDWTEREGETADANALRARMLEHAPRSPFVAEPLNLQTFQEYRDYPAVAQSDLKSAWDNPQLFYEHKIGLRQKNPPTASMLWGTACESYIRNGCCQEVHIIPQDVLSANGQRRGKRWTEYKEHVPKTDRLMTQSEYDDEFGAFSNVKDNIDCHQQAFDLLGGDIEWSTRWTWTDGDMEYKSEFDVIDHARKFVVDIKTAVDVDPHNFERSVIHWGYDIQAAHYLTPIQFQDYRYYWIAIRNKPPYNVEVYEPSTELFEYGVNRVVERIKHFKRCCGSGQWVSDTHGSISPLYPPKWSKK